MIVNFCSRIYFYILSKFVCKNQLGTYKIVQSKLIARTMSSTSSGSPIKAL